MKARVIHRDAESLKFSNQILKAEGKNGAIMCPKCQHEIINRVFTYSRVFARCTTCDICYWVSKDRGKVKKLEVVYDDDNKDL